MAQILTKREKREKLKERVKVLKAKLKPHKNWISDFFEKNKQWDSHYWSLFLRNMMSGNVTDEQLIIALEKYAKTIDNQ